MGKYKIEKLMEETKEELNNNIYDSKIDGGAFCDYSEGAYICDTIMEIADYNIDIYYCDLFEWAKNNYSIIEEANEELGTPSDIIKQIQQGEYLQNERDIYDNLSNMLLLYSYNLLKDNGINEILEEQNTELISYCDNLDNNDRLPDISDLQEVLNYEESEE